MQKALSTVNKGGILWLQYSILVLHCVGISMASTALSYTVTAAQIAVFCESCL